jgi:ATP-dependent Clp protease ATP-binding subunit ClpA
MAVLDWVDEIIQFAPLSREHLRQITELTVRRLTDEMKTRYNCSIRVDSQVLDWISLQAEASGRFAHAVIELVDRKIRIKAMDMIPAGDDRISLAVRMESGQIHVVPG